MSKEERKRVYQEANDVVLYSNSWPWSKEPLRQKAEPIELGVTSSTTFDREGYCSRSNWKRRLCPPKDMNTTRLG